MNDSVTSVDGEAAGQPDHFMVAGNRLELLTEGPQRLAALLALIDGATSSLRLLYYIYTSDRSGQAVRDALMAALDRGVRVSLIVDGFGSYPNLEFFRPLEQKGASICRFIPRIGRRFLLRNHQKLTLADDSRALVGGFNIEDDYFADTDAPDAWRDLGLLVEGPAARRLAGYFDALSQWAHTPKAPMRDLRRALGRWSEHAGPIRWLMGGPTRKLSPWAQALKADAFAALRFDVISGYFIPGPGMLRRIGPKRRLGRSRTRIVTAAKSDNLSTIAAARHTYRLLLDRGVEIYEFGACKLHTKLIVIDNISYIGSANLDMRSLYLNLEIMLRIDDAAFADHMRAYVDRECALSARVTPEEHRREGGWLARLRWGFAYFLLAVVDPRLTRRLNFGVEAE
nr:phospholipase D-like domain-containing protein [Sphingomonas laterariae]